MDGNLNKVLAGLNAKIDWVIANYPRENLLDNWYFVDPVNSRGQDHYNSSASNKVYCIDRWYLEQKDGMTVTPSKDGLKITQNSNSNRICQKLPKLLDNLTYTLSIYTNRGQPNPLNFYGGTSKTEGILSYDSSTNIIAITPTTNTILYFVKLELGANSTLLNKNGQLTAIPNKAMELNKCYYFGNDEEDVYTNYKVYEVRTNKPQHLKTIWIDSSKNNIAKIYDGSSWVEAFGGKQFAMQASAPDTSKLWIDSNNSNVIKFYNGTDWVTCSGAWS